MTTVAFDGACGRSNRCTGSVATSGHVIPSCQLENWNRDAKPIACDLAAAFAVGTYAGARLMFAMPDLSAHPTLHVYPLHLTMSPHSV